jgi:hypothetical protein
VQLALRCVGLLKNAFYLHLFVEVIAFCRELIRIRPTPAAMQSEWYLRAAGAMMRLQKLDEAEKILHEGLVACRQEGVKTLRVGRIVPPRQVAV